MKQNKKKYYVRLLMNDGLPIRIVISAKDEEQLQKEINKLNGVIAVLSVEEKIVKLSMFNESAETFSDVEVDKALFV